MQIDVLTTYWIPFLWGLLVLMGLWGIGRSCLLVLRQPAEGWGFEATIGMALALLAGGGLMLLRLATEQVLFVSVMIAAGVGFFHALRLYREKRLPRFDSTGQAVFVVGLLVIGLGYYASSILRIGGFADDGIVYGTFVQKILQTGTLIEPFSLRRAGAYGGQSFLEALIQCGGTGRVCRLLVLEEGICRLLLCGLAIRLVGGGVSRHAPARLLAGIVGIAIVCVPIIRTNSNALLTGVVICLGLFMHLKKTEILTRRADFASISIAALLLMAAATLRPSYAMLGGLAILGGLAFVRKPREIMPFIWCYGLAAVLLSPWMALLWQSSGTIALPPFHGNVNPHFASFVLPEGRFPTLCKALSDLLTDKTLPYLLSGLLLLVGKPPKKILIIFFAATMLCFITICYFFANTTKLDLLRYIQPLPIPFFALIASMASTDAEWVPSARFPLVAVLVACAALGTAGHALKDYWSNMRRIMLNLAGSSREMTWPLDPTAIQEAQKAVPSGEKILAVIEAAYLLDYHRNEIYNIDIIGAASPPPGMPALGTPEELRQYLLSQGIHYILATDFDAPPQVYGVPIEGRLYGRDFLARFIKEGKRPEVCWQEWWLPAGRRVMQNIDTLAAESGGKMVNGYHVIPLLK